MKKMFLFFVCVCTFVSCSQDADLLVEKSTEEVEMRNVATGVFNGINIKYGYGPSGTLYATVRNVYTGIVRDIIQPLTYSQNNNDLYVEFGGPHQLLKSKLVVKYNNSELIFDDLLSPKYDSTPNQPAKILFPQLERKNLYVFKEDRLDNSLYFGIFIV